MKTRPIFLATLILAALTLSASERSQPLSDLGKSYVKLTLALGEHDADWVDAYYGPEEWRTEVRKAKPSLKAIEEDARKLLRRVELAPRDEDRIIELRKRYLIAQLNALITRAQMLGGLRLPFDEEAKRLYGLTPPHHDDKFFQDAVAALDKEVPGPGPLGERLENYRKRFYIPPAKVDAVIRAAMAECRARTLAHTKLPKGESFTLEYVHDKPWGGYNWYKGSYKSLIQINLDLPVAIQRALDLACHEGYPGHHAYNVLLEKNLVHDRGWMEYTVYPLFSPQSLVAEGTGNYGLEIAFPGKEREEFDRTKLFPLAGLDPKEAARYHRVLDLSARLAYASNEAARRYLDGVIKRPEAEAWLVANALYTPERARQQLDFIERYRSYVINYNAGRDAVKTYIEGKPAKQRWPAFIDLISTPRLLSE